MRREEESLPPPPLPFLRQPLVRRRCCRPWAGWGTTGYHFPQKITKLTLCVRPLYQVFFLCCRNHRKTFILRKNGINKWHVVKDRWTYVFALGNLVLCRFFIYVQIMRYEKQALMIRYNKRLKRLWPMSFRHGYILGACEVADSNRVVGTQHMCLIGDRKEVTGGGSQFWHFI